MKTAALRLIALSFVTAGTTDIWAAKSGSELFGEFCAPCHGPDGKARTPAGRKLGAKDLSQSKLADPEIEKQIANGTKDARGIDRMPPFKEKLTASDIAALVAYVKSFRQ
jgi:mono/diheme cytochrome c family protein